MASIVSDFLCTLSIMLPFELLYKFHRARGLFVDITVTLYLPPTELSGELEIATQTATFKRTLRLSSDKSTGEAARAAVTAALGELHIDDEAALKHVSDSIVSRGDELMARRSSWIEHLKEIRVKPQINICVDALPPLIGSYVCALPLSYDDNKGEDDGVLFFPVSEKSIEGLAKTNEITEEAVTCELCSDEAPVGSESISSPCSHRYHVKGIVWWFEESHCNRTRVKETAITSATKHELEKEAINSVCAKTKTTQYVWEVGVGPVLRKKDRSMISVAESSLQTSSETEDLRSQVVALEAELKRNKEKLKQSNEQYERISTFMRTKFPDFESTISKPTCN